MDCSEAMEFLRHVRNGIAHGGEFDFRGDEPRHPAILRRPAQMNGDLVITAKLRGHRVFPQFMALGDAMDLLDAVKRHVVT